MKPKIILFALFMTLISETIFSQDTPRIAVYVTGKIGNDEKKALGTRMLSSLVNSGRYIGIERSDAFLAEIDKEHAKQRSGAIDDDQISRLGKQHGVGFVCIADITPAFGEFQISARIVDVETAEVAFIGEASGQLKSMRDLERISGNAVKNMFSKASVRTPISPQPNAGAQTCNAPGYDNSFTDYRDCKTYRTVTIGGKTWMAENLNYHPQNGIYWGYTAHGVLYDWKTAMASCPVGWHLPTDAEWDALVNAAGGREKAGIKLKSKSDWKSKRKVAGGTNEYGFAAMPGGFRSYDGHFNDAGSYGYWWTATEYGSNNASYRYMSYDREHVGSLSRDKRIGASVRCVSDE